MGLTASFAESRCRSHMAVSFTDFVKRGSDIQDTSLLKYDVQAELNEHCYFYRSYGLLA